MNLTVRIFIVDNFSNSVNMIAKYEQFLGGWLNVNTNRKLNYSQLLKN